MSRRFIIGIAIVLVIGLMLLAFLSRIGKAPVLPITEKELAAAYAANATSHGVSNVDLTPRALAQPPISRPVRLAIGGLGLADDDRNQQLGDLVTVQLTGTPGFDLVERRSLATIMGELNLNWSGFVRAGDAVRAGKLLNADWFLLGTPAVINGTNCLVVRVVDASTGIMRDAGALSAEKPMEQLAGDLATFMLNVRHDAANPKPRIYLAVGAFGDLSLNDRRADFPTQLRGYLTAAYHGSPLIPLEREYVETLLKEVDLDLAGLTDHGEENSAATMQSAYWLVSGQYQSYETTNFQVEVSLNIRRVFGRTWYRTVRGLPGDSVGREVKAAVDDIIDHNSGAIALSRASEARMQFGIGRDLFALNKIGSVSDRGLASAGLSGNGDDNSDPQVVARRQRNFQEAMRAFETVLLLEPTNRNAKLCVAACSRALGDIDHACNYYCEVINAPVEDRWSDIAEQALVETFRWSAPDQRLRWFRSAAGKTTNATAIAFYTQQIEAANRDMAATTADATEVARLAKQHLFDNIKSAGNFLKMRPGVYQDSLGIDDYVTAMQWDPPTASEKLAALLPEMEKQDPDLTPYLVANVLTHQTSTNTSLVAEFERILDDAPSNSGHILRPDQFWDNIRWYVYDWCFEKTNYSLAVRLIEGERKAAAADKQIDFDDQENIKLGYAYMAAERWQDALDIFSSFKNREVRATGQGPWGETFQPILTDKLVADCRRKMGLAPALDPRAFEMDKPVMCLCSPSTFVTDNDGLWVGISGHLLHLDFELRTNLDVELPTGSDIVVNALSVTPAKIWLGTQGGGLLEFDRATHQFRQLTQKDGMMMDKVSSLNKIGDSLWIGYGDHNGGGVGQLQLSSGKFNSFMASLDGDVSLLHGEPPPQAAVQNILAAPGEKLWMWSAHVVREYQLKNGTWSTLPKQSCYRVTCFTADDSHLIEGGAGSFGRTEPGTLAVQYLDDKHWQQINDPIGLQNPPSTMTLDGNNLWVGGEGTIALIDLNTCKVRKYCHVKADTVQHIEIAGGYMWAQFDWHLYRVLLSPLE